MKWQYAVTYRRSPLSSRVYHRTVIAASPDEARHLVAGLDPEYSGTVRTPQRRAAVIPLEATR